MSPKFYFIFVFFLLWLLVVLLEFFFFGYVVVGGGGDVVVHNIDPSFFCFVATHMFRVLILYIYQRLANFNPGTFKSDVQKKQKNQVWQAILNGQVSANA